MTNADKMRRLDDEHLAMLLYEQSRNTAESVLHMVADAFVAYVFDEKYKKDMKEFLKKKVQDS